MTVAQLLEQAKTIERRQQKEPVMLLVERLTSQPPAKKRSLRELQDLGKEIWEGLDAQEYVNELRGKPGRDSLARLPVAERLARFRARTAIVALGERRTEP